MKKLNFYSIQHALNNPLPGVRYHQDMWPEGRKKPLRDSFYPAATLLLIYLQDGELFFPLIRRSDRKDDHHRGQISLPGGHMEKNENPVETAIRETAEEIGVDVYTHEIAGMLTPLPIPHSGFIVHPSVAYTERRLQFSPDPKEVEEIIHVRLSELLEHPEKGRFNLENGYQVPGFLFSNVNVWGATAMILNEFRALKNALV
jgi:8-oxo-dGTP pyrophosphatase MutT (NUDIX family)